MSSWIDARHGRNSITSFPPGPGRYMNGEICLNGHPMTGNVERYPELTAKFCSTCGEQTLRVCPNCNILIRGEHVTPNVCVLAKYIPPDYCYNCGNAFPWKTKKIAAAKEYAAEIEGLNEDEKRELQVVIDDLVAGGAKTELAVHRFKRLMKKAGQAIGGGFYKIVIDVATEAAKKAIIGP